jgi:hypothetical protein
MQKSHKAFLIGIAAGSTEEQDCMLLNERLPKVTGIKGIEVSFQNVNQNGITQEFWKVANKKAEAISQNKNSRTYLQCKYRWAPNALAVYVPSADLVASARKIMIAMFGKFKDKDDPIWPDGSSMRFLPLKVGNINSDRTRDLVRKCFAYHIWMKSQELVIPAGIKNIHDTCDEFDNKTFSEIILGQKHPVTNRRVFSHFKRMWHQDPTIIKWGLSVNPDNIEEANEVLRNLRKDLEGKYDRSLDHFFIATETDQRDTKFVRQTDNDDDWFTDDFFDKMITSGSLKSEFIQFLRGDDSDKDKESIASWGTGDTAYTDIVVSTSGKEVSLTDTSTITPDSTGVSETELLSQKGRIQEQLEKKNISQEDIHLMLLGKPPYDVIMNGITLHTWNLENTIVMLLAIHYHYKQNTQK